MTDTSKAVERFSIDRHNRTMVYRELGDYVTYADYATLYAQLEAAKAEAARARDDALVEAMNKLRTEYRISSFFVDGHEVFGADAGTPAECYRLILALCTQSCDTKPAENATQTGLCKPDTQQEPAQVTVDTVARAIFEASTFFGAWDSQPKSNIEVCESMARAALRAIAGDRT